MARAMAPLFVVKLECLEAGYLPYVHHVVGKGYCCTIGCFDTHELAEKAIERHRKELAGPVKWHIDTTPGFSGPC